MAQKMDRRSCTFFPRADEWLLLPAAAPAAGFVVEQAGRRQNRAEASTSHGWLLGAVAVWFTLALWKLWPA